MKQVITALLLVLLNISCFSQKGKQTDRDLVFMDTCSGDRINPEFKIETYSETYQMITAYINRGDLIARYTVLLDPINDTINIPKILFAYKSQTDDSNWNTMNCDQICNGTETEFHPNGNKSTEGVFVNGKPREIKTFRENGSMISHAFYNTMSLDFSRINYYSDEDELIKYQTYENNEMESIIKVFDKNGTLINTSVEKKNPEK